MIDTPQSPMFAIRSSLFLNITTHAVEDPTIPYRYEEALAYSMTLHAHSSINCYMPKAKIK